MGVQTESPILLRSHGSANLKTDLKKALAIFGIPTTLVMAIPILFGGDVGIVIGTIGGVCVGIFTAFLTLCVVYSGRERERLMAKERIATDDNCYVHVKNALHLLGHKTTQFDPYIITDNSGLVYVQNSVSVMTVNDARRMASKHNLSSICIVCNNSNDYVSSKAEKLAKNCNIMIINYQDVLDTVYDCIESNN